MPKNHEYITLVMRPKSIDVEGGSHGRDYWYAPGLTVCVKGALPVSRYAAAANIAMNECLARHISIRSLRSVAANKQQIEPKNPRQKGFWDDD